MTAGDVVVMTTSALHSL